jgi:hypothetical protein
MCLFHLITLYWHPFSFFLILLFTSIFLILHFITISSHFLHSYVDVWWLLNLIFLFVNSMGLIRKSQHSKSRFHRIINRSFIPNSLGSVFIWTTENLWKMENCSRLANSVVQGVGGKFLSVLSLALWNEGWRWPSSGIVLLTFITFLLQIYLIIYGQYFRKHWNSLSWWLCTIEETNSSDLLVYR